MSKKKRNKKKGRKRKSKLSQAAANKARDRSHEYAMSQIPLHPDDLENFDAIPASFSHSLRSTVGWRCQNCKYEWFGRLLSYQQCPKCRNERIQQEDALYRCLNCENEFWGFPGFNGLPGWQPTICPSKKCKDPNDEPGPKHPGNENDRGYYVKWTNYEEWIEHYGPVV